MIISETITLNEIIAKLELEMVLATHNLQNVKLRKLDTELSIINQLETYLNIFKIIKRELDKKENKK